MGVIYDIISFVFCRFCEKCDNLFRRYVEIIDSTESESMIEICGRLDKANTKTGLVVFAIFRFLFQEVFRLNYFLSF